MHLEHNLCEQQFWTVHPSSTKLKQAHTYLLGQILCVSHEGKPTVSSRSDNPNTKAIILVYSYDDTKKVFQPGGRTALLSVVSFLITDVSNYVTSSDIDTDVQLDFRSLESYEILKDYVPYHDDLDISTRIQAVLCSNPTSSALSDIDEEADDDINSDPYLVEKIIKKKYNSHKNQYEY